VNVLMVITSHDQLGNLDERQASGSKSSQRPTTFFKDAGVGITLASPRGGRPLLDPKSNEPGFRTDFTLISRSASRRTQLRKLSSIRPFASTAASKKTSTPYFTPGGHGPM
jgi:hypothetical protein